MKTITRKSPLEIPANFTGKALLPDSIHYYKNGLLHKEDGPAVEWANGDKAYYINNKRHRIGGDACEYDGFVGYFINDKRVTKEQHDLLYNMMKLKRIETL